MSDKENIISNKTQTKDLMMLIFSVLNFTVLNFQSCFLGKKLSISRCFFQVIVAVCMRINLINLPKQAFIVKAKSSLNTRS